MFNEVIAQALLAAGIIVAVLGVAVVYMVTKTVFGRKTADGYKFESAGPQAERAEKAGNTGW